ncbi:MAG TPA: M23 family metallopeptidase [Candidatus Avalokitesvara rifleensis]|uniref:M23 family metallopeptidase n=1 Tax=Candidatus Avalokitesvara rifleensis TaxID=3367620 RepID=UPI0027126921|nr:M23 family metallopeptidase [Candidatus Brocadiales bacterium]
MIRKVTNIALVLLFLFISNGNGLVLGMTMPVEGLPSYSEFPSDEDEPPMTSDPRSWYSTVYCGKYLGYWQSRGEGSGSHPGVDIRIGTGTPVKAIARGRVFGRGFMWRWGNTVVIEHRNMPGVPEEEPIYTIYAHLSKISVEMGKEVEEGSIVGLSGDTGAIEIPHLHFQIDRYVEGAKPPFYPKREGQCVRCEWFDPKHVVNHPDTDNLVRRHTINPIEYILRFKNHKPLADMQFGGNRQRGKRHLLFEEGKLYKGSGLEIYLYLNGYLHLIPDSATLSILSKDNSTNKVTNVPDQVLLAVPCVQDIPPLSYGLAIRGLDPEVYIIQENGKKPLHQSTPLGENQNKYTDVLRIPEWLLEFIPTIY